MNVDAIRFFGAMIDLLWLALAAAVGVAVLAAAWLVGRAVSQRLERRYLPDVQRWSRRRAGLAEDAGPWACPACRSVNVATVVTCYGCGTGRAEEALELTDAAVDETVFHQPPSRSRFDPALYRGPGALPPDDGAPGAAGTVVDGPVASYAATDGTNDPSTVPEPAAATTRAVR